jgi:hypothetical protein
MALGCIPSHASYFFAYENLKVFFAYNNDQFDLVSTLSIGCSTTFVHDFFITPSDGKQLENKSFSPKIALAALQ